MHTFNFWFLVAPFGAIVAAFLGYYLHDKCYVKIMTQAFSVIMAAVIFVMFFWESYDGAVQFCMTNDGDPAMADFCAIGAFILTAIFYYGALLWCAEHGEYLNYPPDERKPLREARRKNPDIKWVITAKQLQRALQSMPSAKEDDIEWLDLDAQPTHVTSSSMNKAATITPIEHSAKLAPDRQRARIAKQAYEDSLARAQALLDGFRSHAQTPAKIIDLSQRLTKGLSVEEQINRLEDPRDREIAWRQISENQFLRRLLDYPDDNRVRLTMVGEGENRRVRLSCGRTIRRQQQKVVGH